MAYTKKQEEEVKQAMQQSPLKTKETIFLQYKVAQDMKGIYLKN
jgi:hypothetical protein